MQSEILNKKYLGYNPSFHSVDMWQPDFRAFLIFVCLEWSCKFLTPFVFIFCRLSVCDLLFYRLSVCDFLFWCLSVLLVLFATL